MNRIYLLLLSLLVSYGASARLVFYDSNYDGSFSGTPMCHAWQNGGGVASDFESDVEKMTSLGNSGWVFKVIETNNPDLLMFYDSSETTNQSGTMSLIDGQAYYKGGLHNANEFRVVLRGNPGGQESDCADLVTFKYNNDNTFVSDPVTVNWSGMTSCGINFFMFTNDAKNDRGWIKGNGSFSASDLLSGVKLVGGSSDNMTITLSGTYTFKLDLNDVTNIKLSATPEASVPLEQMYISLGTNRNSMPSCVAMEGGADNTFSYSYDSNGQFFFYLSEVSGSWPTGLIYSPQSSGNYVITDSNDQLSKEISVSKNNTLNVFEVDGSGSYIITVNGADKNNVKVTVTKIGTYYFYGDMNRWSSLKEQGKVNIEDVNEADITSKVWPDGDEPSYYTPDELNATWKFKPVDAKHSAKGAGWYYLDFANISDEAGNKGRLCGQFKITTGDHEGSDNWGVQAATTDGKITGGQAMADYLTNKIKVGEKFNGGKKGIEKQNYQLDCSYVENAVLYFNPSANDGNGEVYITGTDKYIYVYYGCKTSTDYNAPSDAEISDRSQVNYYVNSYGFNGDGFGGEDASTFNPSGQYNWKEYSAATEGASDYIKDGKVVYNGMEFDKVYRKLIPYGATHRFPVEFNVKVTSSDGNWFPQVRVDCEDIWFVEAYINLNFRYEDDRELKWVKYNAFAYTYDDMGIVSGQTWAYSNDRSAREWAHTRPGDTAEHTWWQSDIYLPYNFTTGAYALFRTSEGAVYPVGGVNASDKLLQEALINGEDLYYVVPVHSDNPEILYSHKKGTYQQGADHAKDNVIQIEAEFWNGDGTLDTSYGDTTYSFKVFEPGATTDPIASSGNATSSYTPAPYYDWNVSGLAAGYYQIEVKVNKNGEIYSSSDVYPIFPAEGTEVTTNGTVSAAAYPVNRKGAIIIANNSGTDWTTPTAHLWNSGGDVANITMTNITGSNWYYCIPSDGKEYDHFGMQDGTTYKDQTGGWEILSDTPIRTKDGYGVEIIVSGIMGSSDWKDYSLSTYISGNKYKSQDFTLANNSTVEFGLKLADSSGNQVAFYSQNATWTSNGDSFQISTGDTGNNKITNNSGSEMKYHFELDYQTMTLSLVTEDTPVSQYSVPLLKDLKTPYWVSTFTGGTSYKDKVLSITPSHSDGKFSWVKYEDTAVYDADETGNWHLWSDNPLKTGEFSSDRPHAIDLNETTSHDCRNFSDAYYRFYMEHKEDPTVSAATKSAVTKANRDNEARVARTKAVSNNTTGVEDIVVDGGGSVEDSDAPVVYYNLQGVQVKNPSTGLYIRVQGKKADKVYIR